MKKSFIIFLVLVNFSFLNAKNFINDPNMIFKNLRCLVCQGQSVADSNSEFAQTLKLVVKEKIKEGKTDEEIYSFLIEKYGEWIVYDPPFNKTNSALWVLPYVILVAGGTIILIFLRKRGNR